MVKKREFYLNKIGVHYCSICGKIKYQHELKDKGNFVCFNCYKKYKKYIQEGIL